MASDAAVEALDSVDLGDAVAPTGEGQECSSDTTTTDQDQLHQLAVELSRDFSCYLAVDASKEEKKLDDAIEDLLTRLEEFCGLLDMIRMDNNICLEQLLKRVHEKSLMMEQVYEKIDKIAEFCEVVKRSIVSTEEEVAKAEELFAKNSVKKLFSSLLVSSNKRLVSSSRKPKFVSPEIFRTSDYIGLITEETSPNRQEDESGTSTSEIIS